MWRKGSTRKISLKDMIEDLKENGIMVRRASLLQGPYCQRKRWLIPVEGHVVRLGIDRIVLKMVTGKSSGRRPLRRPRLRGEGSKEMNASVRSWIDLILNRDF